MGCTINASLSGNDGKVVKILNFFIGKGLTPVQACAICGNVWQCSNYDETTVNEKTKTFGLFKFNPKYAKDLESNPKKNDFDYQLDYVWGKYSGSKHYGDSNKGSALYKKWRKTELSEYFKQDKGTIDDYVELWLCAFERSDTKDADLDGRKKEAKRVVELYNKNATGDCTKIETGSSDNTTEDNGSVSTDSGDVNNNNGAVTDATQPALNCGSITVGGVVSSEGGGASSGTTTGGFSGTVTNEKMKLVLSDTSYYRNPPRSMNGTKHYLKPGEYNHLCTYGPTTWYYNAGITLCWWCGSWKNPDFECVKKRMHSYDFYCAGHWDFEEARNLPTSVFRPGDVAALLPNIQTSHGLMWTGSDWRSDCIEQNICSAYPRCKNGRDGNYSVSIWRRHDCQEPGLENDEEVT